MKNFSFYYTGFIMVLLVVVVSFWASIWNIRIEDEDSD